MSEKLPKFEGMTERFFGPHEVGEAVMASIGSPYADYPSPDQHGIRVPIPGHPEIVAYRLEGNPTRRGSSVDDLIELYHLVKSQEAQEAAIDG